ncbi:hypothetical protein KFE98_08845 [bacterium SCSIO 12741]|nr:hypothetical protein KFE98_08845 [bacterium SCSIO 12741]
MSDIFLMDLVEYLFKGLSPIEARIYSLHLQGERSQRISRTLRMPVTHVAQKLEKIKAKGKNRLQQCA